MALKNNPADVFSRATLGRIRFDQKNWPKAIINFTSVLKMAKKQNNTDLQAQAYVWRGKAYAKQGNLHLGLVDFTKSEEICQKIVNYPCIILSRHFIGVILFKRGDLDRAEAILVKNVALARKTYNKKALAQEILGLGMVRVRKEDKTAGCKLLIQAKTLFSSLNNNKMIHKTKNAISSHCSRNIPDGL